MIHYRRNFDIKPLISVVLCSYNRAEYIGRAIDSVLNQKTEFSYEIIIGDDASTDDSAEILMSYQQKYPEIFTIILHQKNNGAGSNWAQLIQISKAKYIALCDDDDYWHDENKLQLQVKLLENDKAIGLVHTDFRYFFPSKNKFKEIKINNKVRESLFHSLFDGEYLIINSTVVFRRELIEKYVNLEDYKKYNFPTQDWVTWMQIAKYTKFEHIPVLTSTYCVSNESVTRTRDFDALAERYEREKMMYQYICEKFSDELIYDTVRWEQYVYKIFLAFSYNVRDFERAKFYAKKLHNKSIKVLFSQNILLFKLFIFIKKIIN